MGRPWGGHGGRAGHFNSQAKEFRGLTSTLAELHLYTQEHEGRETVEVPEAFFGLSLDNQLWVGKS